MKKLILYVSCGLFSLQAARIANAEPTTQPNIKKEVPIYNKWKDSEKRTVWAHKNLEFFSHPFDLQPASSDAYKMALKYQKRLETTDTTSIILNDPSITTAYSVYASHPEHGRAQLIRINPFTLQGHEFNVVLAHELAHNKDNLGYVKMLQNNHQYYRVRQAVPLYLSAACAGLTLLALYNSSDSQYLKLFGGLTIASGSFYAKCRIEGARIASQLHKIELDCDTTAVSLEKTPEEQMKLAKAGKNIFKRLDAQNRETTKHHAHRILFSHDIPQNSVRAANFQSIIDGIKQKNKAA